MPGNWEIYFVSFDCREKRRARAYTFPKFVRVKLLTFSVGRNRRNPGDQLMRFFVGETSNDSIREV